MTTQVPLLATILADIPDPRQARGKRYPLRAMPNVVCLALLSGYQTVKAIAEWGTNYGEQYVLRLGFKEEHGYPAQSSCYRVLGQVDCAAVEQGLRLWCGQVMATLSSEAELVGASIDT